MTHEERMRRRKNRARRRIIANVVIAVVVGVGCFLAGRLSVSSSEIVKNLTNPSVASECEHLFDSSIIEAQWYQETDSTVRVMGGWMYKDGVVQGETEEEWTTELPLSQEDFYLLWIDDAGTPTVEDDTLIKLWREVH